VTAIAYTVTCQIADPARAAAWVAWLKDGHIAAVIAAGAQDAALVRMDGQAAGAPAVYEVRYTFADRAAFDAYVARHAPRLRAEGAALFPPGDGFIYSRSTGDILI
jgi:hypothetical protein